MEKNCEFRGFLTILRWFLKLSHSAVAVPHHCRPLYKLFRWYEWVALSPHHSTLEGMNLNEWVALSPKHSTLEGMNLNKWVALSPQHSTLEGMNLNEWVSLSPHHSTLDGMNLNNIRSKISKKLLYICDKYGQLLLTQNAVKCTLLVVNDTQSRSMRPARSILHVHSCLWGCQSSRDIYCIQSLLCAYSPITGWLPRELMLQELSSHLLVLWTTPPSGDFW